MNLLPGDVGFSTIGGRVGALVNLGQSLLRDSSRYTHTWICVETYKGGAVTVLEAMPSGARIRLYDPAKDGGPVYRLSLEDRQRDAVRAQATGLVGTPYSFADYLALALWEWIPAARISKALRRYVTNSGRMICSQLVDHVLTQAGYHLFDDGRLPQDVTPGDIFYACLDQGERVAL
jgi:hypothetical protein